MYAGYVYAGLRTDGDLFVPPLPNPLAPVEGVVHWFQASDAFDLPDWPTAVSFGGAMGFWAALAVSLLFCVALGLVIHLLIFRPLRHAPQLAKVVASVGLLLLMQAIVIRRFATTPRTVKPLTFVSKQRVDLWAAGDHPGATVRRGAGDRVHGGALGAVPVHPLRSRHASRRRERARRRRARLLARSPRRHQLGARHVHHRAARHLRRFDQLERRADRGAGPDPAGALGRAGGRLPLVRLDHAHGVPTRHAGAAHPVHRGAPELVPALGQPADPRGRANSCRSS